MRTIHPFELGATLFTPVTKDGLEEILSRKKYPHLKSLLIDLEDGLENERYEEGLAILQSLLECKKHNDLLVFVRPRDPDSLQELLQMQYIQRINGFILPKFSLENANTFLGLLENTPFYFMPSLEDKEIFDARSLKEIRALLLPYKKRIVCLRLGCEDMLRQLRLQRIPSQSIFERSVTAHVMATLLATFKPYGFEISGCVYPFYNDTKGFVKDVKRDLAEGLVSKSVIHPSQIELLHECYRVSQEELEDAKKLLASSKTLFGEKGKMVEQHTQAPYARTIMLRAELFGVTKI